MEENDCQMHAMYMLQILVTFNLEVYTFLSDALCVMLVHIRGNQNDFPKYLWLCTFKYFLLNRPLKDNLSLKHKSTINLCFTLVIYDFQCKLLQFH